MLARQYMEVQAIIKRWPRPERPQLVALTGPAVETAATSVGAGRSHT
mgnify:CR=1 FL=1